MVSIRAHFDGKVFLPDEPVGLPPNASVRLLLVPEADGGDGEAEFPGLGESGLKFSDNETDDEV